MSGKGKAEDAAEKSGDIVGKRMKKSFGVVKPFARDFRRNTLRFIHTIQPHISTIVGSTPIILGTLWLYPKEGT